MTDWINTHRPNVRNDRVIDARAEEQRRQNRRVVFLALTALTAVALVLNFLSDLFFLTRGNPRAYGMAISVSWDIIDAVLSVSWCAAAIYLWNLSARTKEWIGGLLTIIWAAWVVYHWWH